MASKLDHFLSGVVIGGVVGAVIGVLFAPKSGKELREELGVRADEMVSKAREEYLDKLEKTKKAYESTLSRLSKIEAAANERIEELGSKASAMLKKEAAEKE